MRFPYVPDYWILINVPFPEGDEVKVLAGWAGGYLDGDSWRLSSGVKAANPEDDHWEIENSSGSIYLCHKEMERLGIATAGMFNHIVEKYEGAKQIMMEDYLSDLSK